MVSMCPAQLLHGAMRTPLASLLSGDSSVLGTLVVAQRGPASHGTTACAQLAGFAGPVSLGEDPQDACVALQLCALLGEHLLLRSVQQQCICIKAGECDIWQDGSALAQGIINSTCTHTSSRVLLPLQDGWHACCQTR